MWLSLLLFVMNTVVVGHHFDELKPSQGGPLLMCSLICYSILMYQCCSNDALASVPFFIIWASILAFVLVSIFETWAFISALWCFSAMCLQCAYYWYKTRQKR